MSFIKHLFNKKNSKDSIQESESSENKSDQRICSLMFDLIDTESIDISIELCDIKIDESNFHSMANKIATFLHLLNNGALSINIANIMINQIGSNPKYSKFIDTIIQNWIVYQTEHEKQITKNKNNTPVIKPTEVFGKYYNK